MSGNASFNIVLQHFYLQVAADVLERLWNASQSDGASFQVSALSFASSTCYTVSEISGLSMQTRPPKSHDEADGPK